MKKFLGRALLLLLVTAFGGLAVLSFIRTHDAAHSAAKADSDDDDAEKPIKVPSRVSNVGGVPTITLNEAALSRNDIATATLTRHPEPILLRAYGSVLELQSLTDLANRYAAAKADCETQQAKRDFSKSNVTRARALYNETPRAISQAQLETAEESSRVDEAALNAANAHLSSLAHTAIQAWGDVLGKAITGPSSQLADLIERREVLVQVTLRADQNAVTAPAKAFVQMSGGGPTIPVTYVSHAATTDPHIQGQSFFYTAAAASGLLPGMNVMAFVPTGDDIERTHIPAAAIVWMQGRAWAYFRNGPKALVRREIATDAPAPDGGYFVKDIPDGSKIVVRGAQMLLSEEFRAQIQSED
ncbi:MAG TPA: efflux RND transporter periplasmic adaptor subunit [Methylovirgula sp.]|nr:efflux RND transporter periplasmic adaptor subunit [Methylovirgula sp.]